MTRVPYAYERNTPMTSRFIAGIDFSTKSADTSFLAPDGTRLGRHRRFDNSFSGLQDLKQAVLEILATHEYDGVDLAGEATGMYWLPFFLELAADAELAAHDAQLFLLNPRLVKLYKQSIAHTDKTDPNDAFYIADRIRVRRPRVPWEAAPQQLALRCYTRGRFHFVKHLAAFKSFFGAYLFLKANTYQRAKPFSNVFGATSRRLLEQCVTFDELAALPVAELADQLDALSQHRLPDPLDNATVLQQVATESFSLPKELILPVHRITQLTLAQITSLEARITQFEGWIAEELVNFPAIRQLETVPGIGPTLAAAIGAEIGAVDRFLAGTKTDARGRRCSRNLRDAEDAVAKIAGLWWPRFESGNFTAEDRRMAKTGNAYLRYYLIQAADQLRRHAPEYQAFYKRKFQESTKHHHLRALVLTARKSVGLIVGLLHRNEPYRSREAHRT
jgi:transposase